MPPSSAVSTLNVENVDASRYEVGRHLQVPLKNDTCIICQCALDIDKHSIIMIRNCDQGSHEPCIIKYAMQNDLNGHCPCPHCERPLRVWDIMRFYQPATLTLSTTEELLNQERFTQSSEKQALWDSVLAAMSQITVERQRLGIPTPCDVSDFAFNIREPMRALLIEMEEWKR